MATVQSSTPSLFNFLKEGLLLPSHNRRLFAAVFSIIVAFTSLLVLGNDLAIRPFADKIRLGTKVFNSTDPSSPDFHLTQEIIDDSRAFLITVEVYFLFVIVIGSAVEIVVIFASVATYAGELHTFGSLLGKVKTQLKVTLFTFCFVYALELAYVMVLVAMFALLVFLMLKRYIGLFFVVVSLLLLVLLIFFVYFSFICSLSVVVAVAKPGCHGAGALGWAWRLMKGKHGRAILFISVTAVLAAALSPVHTLAKTCALSNMASGFLLGFLYIILTSAVKLFAVCAITTFYYECKASTEASAAAAAEYVEVSTKEQIDA